MSYKYCCDEFENFVKGDPEASKMEKIWYGYKG